eukprot:TRINITY_DN2638_c0_g2_i2.p1 TRINITY_DN2638_c0_g2~~TRINITY_DN2638_c0_g2_i2.p1  ORF type:complete len:110 (-),score=9.12 TRINITY_DN2638_c0_g2_i2:3065-3394(-)
MKFVFVHSCFIENLPSPVHIITFDRMASTISTVVFLFLETNMLTPIPWGLRDTGINMSCYHLALPTFFMPCDDAEQVRATSKKRFCIQRLNYKCLYSTKLFAILSSEHV